jgi:hypothetical protein
MRPIIFSLIALAAWATPSLACNHPAAAFGALPCPECAAQMTAQTFAAPVQSYQTTTQVVQQPMAVQTYAAPIVQTPVYSAPVVSAPLVSSYSAYSAPIVAAPVYGGYSGFRSAASAVAMVLVHSAHPWSSVPTVALALRSTAVASVASALAMAALAPRRLWAHVGLPGGFGGGIRYSVPRRWLRCARRLRRRARVPRGIKPGSAGAIAEKTASFALAGFCQGRFFFPRIRRSMTIGTPGILLSSPPRPPRSALLPAARGLGLCPRTARMTSPDSGSEVFPPHGLLFDLAGQPQHARKLIDLNRPASDFDLLLCPLRPLRRSHFHDLDSLQLGTPRRQRQHQPARRRAAHLVYLRIQRRVPRHHQPLADHAGNRAGLVPGHHEPDLGDPRP